MKQHPPPPSKKQQQTNKPKPKQTNKQNPVKQTQNQNEQQQTNKNWGTIHPDQGFVHVAIEAVMLDLWEWFPCCSTPHCPTGHTQRFSSPVTPRVQFTGHTQGSVHRSHPGFSSPVTPRVQFGMQALVLAGSPQRASSDRRWGRHPS